MSRKPNERALTPIGLNIDLDLGHYYLDTRRAPAARWGTAMYALTTEDGP